MNPSNTPVIPPEVEGIDGLDHDYVAVAFRHLEGVSSMCFYQVFSSLLEREFKTACLSNYKVACMQHPYFTLFMVTVPDRKRTLPIFESLARRIGLIHFSEIAYWDRAELVWRTVHSEFQLPFDRFLSEEARACSTQYIQDRQRSLDALLACQDGQPQNRDLQKIIGTGHQEEG